MSIVACESNAVPVPPITTGSAKLTLSKTFKHKKDNKKRRIHTEGQLPDSLNPSHENRKMKEERMRKTSVEK